MLRENPEFLASPGLAVWDSVSLFMTGNAPTLFLKTHTCWLLVYLLCPLWLNRWGLSGSQGLNQRRQWHPTPVLLPGKSHGQRSLVGCSPWGLKESDMTEWLHFHFYFSLSLSCIGEGNGTPLQYPYLENPRDGGAWWAAVSGVAQSWTRLKRLSSSSSSSKGWIQLRLGHCTRRWGCTWGEGGCVHMLVPTASPWGFLAVLLLISGNCSAWRITEYPGKVLRCFKQSGIWGWGRVFRAEASVSAGAFWKLVSRMTCFYTIFFFSF